MKVSSGIEGFDALSENGFEHGGVNLISGTSGSGKTLFGLHFLCKGLKENEDVLLVTLEEDRKNIKRILVNMGMTAAPRKMHVIDLGALRAGKMEDGDGMIGFKDLREFLENFLEINPVKRIVIDSLAAIGIYYKEIEKLREELFSFVRFLRSKDITTILTTESLEDGGRTRFGVEQFITDSFIILGLEEKSGELRRSITIRKMRFTNHDTAKRPFHITKKGIEIFIHEKVV